MPGKISKSGNQWSLGEIPAEEEILAGRLDVAVTETLHLAQDAAKGKPVMGFSRFLHTDGEPPARNPSHAQALPHTASRACQPASA